MIAVRIGPDMRMAIVGAPSYFRKRSEPTRPQDLIAHNCINLRLPTHGGLYAWEFEKEDHELKVRVEGQLAFNNAYQMLHAALAGYSAPVDVAGCARGEAKFRKRMWSPILQSTSTLDCVVRKSLKTRRRGLDDSSSPSANYQWL